MNEKGRPALMTEIVDMMVDLTAHSLHGNLAANERASGMIELEVETGDVKGLWEIVVTKVR